MRKRKQEQELIILDFNLNPKIILGLVDDNYNLLISNNKFKQTLAQ